MIQSDKVLLSYARLREIFASAFSFDWSSAEHGLDPQNLLTPACFWALVNSVYDPFGKFAFASNQEVLDEVRVMFEQGAVGRVDSHGFFDQFETDMETEHMDVKPEERKAQIADATAFKQRLF